MTTSSVQFLSSRRVQLLGLPQPNTTSQAEVPNPAYARADAVLTPRRVSRNLFGSPRPGEVKELLRNETAQRRSYILQRYNFDILCPQTTAESLSPNQNSSESPKATRSAPLPSLIAKELMEHEKRLGGSESKCVRSDSETSLLSSSPSSRITNQNILKKSGKIQERKTHDDETIEIESNEEIAAMCSSPSKASCRSKGCNKPYARQTFITDCYSLRKRNTGCCNRTTITNDVDAQQKSIEVQKSVASTDSSSSITENTALTNPVIQVGNEYAAKQATCAEDV